MSRELKAACVLALLAAASACESPARHTQARAAEPASEPVVVGDAERGARLLADYQCARCHEGAGLVLEEPSHGCVSCHRAIREGRFDAEPEQLAEWTTAIHGLPDAPHLDGARRFRAEWLVGFLQDPTDLRPNLEATMPRLDLDATDARDLAAALLREAPEPAREAPGDLGRGHARVTERPCGICHLLGGQPLQTRGAPGLVGEELVRARRLAPDLGLARERMTEPMLTAWLRDPEAMHPSTDMPDPELSEREASDIARWLMAAPLPESEPAALPPRLPPATDPVDYEALERDLFRDVCWHCHSDPSFALGDGGPGNHGGFGFAPRGLDLSSYSGLRSGSVDGEGARRSVFREVELAGERMPMIVAVLRARQLEEAGRADPEIRGMPLGFPSVAPELIARLEGWIAQGRPQ